MFILLEIREMIQNKYMEEEDHFTLTQLPALIAALAAAAMAAAWQLSLSLYSLHILTTLCTLSSLSPFIQERKVYKTIMVEKERVVDDG
jgi:hypothetical protein